ncbi:hypothetical protein EON64_21055 [archaeon]|nr:MAG: hypothetical protein EON64_21055 [archaeon]
MHVVGKALKLSQCAPSMRCMNASQIFANPSTSSSGSSAQCRTVPVVRCGEQPASSWLLLNLHVHSKHVDQFRSLRCDCLAPQ